MESSQVLSKAKLQEMFDSAHTLKCDICACQGKEIENLSLAARMYKLYIAQDILSSCIARKGAEKSLDSAKNATSNALELYRNTLAKRGIEAQIYMETAFSLILEKKALLKMAAA